MYVPEPDCEGIAVVKAALRDFLIADLSSYGLPSVTEVLPDGAKGVIDEGFLTDQTPVPVVLITTLGDGQTAAVRENAFARFIVYAMYRGRGLSKVERVLYRMRLRLNATDITRNYFVFPTEVGIRVNHIEASGSTASASFPAWKADGRGLYVWMNLKGLEASY